MATIKSISEAFSMQPKTFEIISEAEYESYYKNSGAEACKEIRLETFQTSSDALISVYVGYNFDGKKVFQYLANSVMYISNDRQILSGTTK